jgi:hypothetical protein
MQLTPRWRKAVLTLHVITSVGWLGADLVLLTLSVAGLTGYRPEIVYPALGFVGLALFVPLSGLVWLIGVFNAWSTPWGLLRHRWVVVKLIITTAMLVAVFFALRPGLETALAQGAALTQRERIGLLFPPVVSTSLLVFATVLSTYKPWGRTRRATAPPSSRRGGERDQHMVEVVPLGR